MIIRFATIALALCCLRATAATISGTVTDENGGAPLEFIRVELLEADFFGFTTVSQVWTDVDGVYQFVDVAAGTYRLSFGDAFSDYILEYYDNVSEAYNGQDIVVNAEDNLTGYDAALTLGGAIEGRVTGPDGEPLEGISVSTHVWQGSFWNWANYSGYTDMDGLYRISGLPPGTYRVGFESFNNQNLVREYYGGSLSLENAVDVPVTAGETVSGIDAHMAAGARLAGQITRPDGYPAIDEVEIRVYRRKGSEWDTYTSWFISGTDGAFDVTGLPPGTYRVRFGGALLGGDPLLREYYDNTNDLESASDLVLPAGGAIENIQAELAVGSRIKGRVTNPSGVSGLSGAFVSAFRFVDGTYDYKNDSYTDVNGNYEIIGLEPGSYRVYAAALDESLADVWYSNTVLRSQSTPINVPPDTTVTNINLRVSAASYITGRVTGPDGVTPLIDIEVTAEHLDDGEWMFTSYAYTDANGEYTIGRLPPGPCRVWFFDYYGTYLNEYYSNSTYDAGAKLVNVPTNGTVTNINASLTDACTISGTVTSEESGLPIGSIYATAYEIIGSTNWEYRGSAATDSGGNFMISGLSTGTYKVAYFLEEWREFGENRPFAPEWYNNAPDFASGATIHLPTFGFTTNNINAALASAPPSGPSTTEPDLTAIERAGGTAWALEYEGELDVDYRVQRYDGALRRWIDTGSISIGTGPSDWVNVPADTNGLQMLRLRVIP